MTMEEAVRNARGFEEQLERETALYEMALQNGSNPSKHFRLMKEAKMMLEEYNGYYKISGHYKDGKDGKEWVVDSKEWVDGIITNIANEAQRLQQRANLGERFLNRTFSNFDKKRDPDAFDACVAYANAENLFSAEKNSLLLFGSPGTGKTHLAAAVANDFVSKGIPTLFGTFVDHLEHIKEEFDHGGTNNYLADMKTVPVLVIDDLGQEKESEWTEQILYQVINHRYEHKSPIIITTNYTEDELANRLGEAKVSRLYEVSYAVVMKSSNYRMER